MSVDLSYLPRKNIYANDLKIYEVKCHSPGPAENLAKISADFHFSIRKECDMQHMFFNDHQDKNIYCSLTIFEQILIHAFL